MAGDGGPAYPHTNWVEDPIGGKRIVKGVYPGMSKLEVFALAATYEEAFDAPFADWKENYVWVGVTSGSIPPTGDDLVRVRSKIEAKVRFLKAEAMVAEAERWAKSHG